MKNIKYIMPILGLVALSIDPDNYLLLFISTALALGVIFIGNYYRKKFGKSILMSIANVLAGLRLLINAILLILELLLLVGITF